MVMNNSRTKWADKFKKNYENESKERRFVHDPFNLSTDKIDIKCDKDGRVTLTENHEEDTYDEINVPASLIFKIAMMLEMTRSLVYLDKKET